jgi:hypothetical protein
MVFLLALALLLFDFLTESGFPYRSLSNRLGQTTHAIDAGKLPDFLRLTVLEMSRYSLNERLFEANLKLTALRFRICISLRSSDWRRRLYVRRSAILRGFSSLGCNAV